MEYKGKTPWTKEERAALKPAFEKIESGYRALEEGLVALRRDPNEGDDPGGGFCGLDCGCSSFLGPRTSPRAVCQRDFCRHRYSVHWT
jgi:hypothetical protein